MGKKKTVLIIDDDRDYVASTRALMEAGGWEVSEAYSGADGLAAAKKKNPDLILLDIIMKEQNEGLVTLEQMRKVPALEKTPVIVISSLYASQPAFQVDPAAGKLAAQLFIPKPIEPAHLLREAARLTGT